MPQPIADTAPRASGLPADAASLISEIRRQRAAVDEATRVWARTQNERPDTPEVAEAHTLMTLAWNEFGAACAAALTRPVRDGSDLAVLASIADSGSSRDDDGIVRHMHDAARAAIGKLIDGTLKIGVAA